MAGQVYPYYRCQLVFKLQNNMNQIKFTLTLAIQYRSGYKTVQFFIVKPVSFPLLSVIYIYVCLDVLSLPG